MTTPALVVAGDKDASAHLTVLGPEWHTDPYFLSPGPKSLLTVFGAEHGLGGVAGYDAAETTDENPERVARAIVMATTHWDNAEILAEVSTGLGEPMHGLELSEIPAEERLAVRGW